MRVNIFDLEANGLLPEVNRIHCAVFRSLDGEIAAQFLPDQMDEMVEYMKSCDVLGGHNVIGYDFPVIEKILGFKYQGKKFDTLVMSRLLNPKRRMPVHAQNQRAGPHSIYAWGVRVGVDKPEHDDWENFSPAMLHRCSEDALINVKVYKELMKEAGGKNWKDAFLMSFKLFENLQKQEQYGWKVDKEYMQFLVGLLDRMISRIDKVIVPKLPTVLEIEETKKAGVFGFVAKPFKKNGDYTENIVKYCAKLGVDAANSNIAGPFSRISFRKVDLNSNEETKSYLLSLGWEPADWNTNDLGERTSPKISKDEKFEGLDSLVGRFCARRIQARQRRGIILGLIDLIRSDGAIPSVINNLADTARATHRNIVNIPKVGSFLGKQMRKMFIAREGKVLVGTDSDSCQLRMLGGRMGDPAYINAIMTGDKALGTDPHSMTKQIAELESRDIAKNVMYCLLFGGGDTKLGKTAKKPGEGAEIRKRVYKGLDGLEQLMNDLTREWKATARRKYNHSWNRWEYFDGYITGLDGRPIKVPYEHQLLVYLLQSDEAIFMSAAYNKCHFALEKAGYIYGKHYGFVCWYHDEFTIECDKDIAEEVKQIAEDSIVWAGKYYKIRCPHVGDGKIGSSWYGVH